jgi:hypothetical protein
LQTQRCKDGKHHLIPTYQPLIDGGYQSARKKNSTPMSPDPRVDSPVGMGKTPGKAASTLASPRPVKGRILTQHTGLPRVTLAASGLRPNPRASRAKHSVCGL